jgi:hypothetical protein
MDLLPDPISCKDVGVTLCRLLGVCPPLLTPSNIITLKIELINLELYLEADVSSNLP